MMDEKPWKEKINFAVGTTLLEMRTLVSRDMFGVADISVGGQELLQLPIERFPNSTEKLASGLGAPDEGY